jgi:sugar phosphate isomerase/epimerase
MELILSTGSIRGVTPTRLFAIAQTAGFEGLEYVVAPDHTAAAIGEIKRLAEETGLPVRNVHAPYLPVPGWGDQIQSLKLTVELASHLEARSVTFHPPQRVMQDVDFARWISSTGDFQRDVGGGEIIVTMENMPKVRSWRGFRVPFTTSPFRYQDRDELWELLEKHNLFMTFDTTHYGTTGESLGGCYAQFRERVRTIHLSNFRSRDFEEHTPLDDGDLDLRGFLRRVESSGYDGLVTLEIRPQAFEQDPAGPREALLRSVKWVREAVASLHPDPHPEVRPAR